MVLSQIEIQRFKNIKKIALDLDKINILVGSNNSGKSSVLQAIQFAISVAQTASLERTTHWRRNGRLPTSIGQMQLIYSPLRDVSALAPFGNLEEDETKGIKIGFNEAESGYATDIVVRRGKNKNIAIELTGPELGRRLQSIESPFSIYVPGLAGIPIFEEYKPPAHVRKAAARGDANSVFRNILWLLKQDAGNWNQFISDFNSIFPHLGLEVTFNQTTEETINAFIIISGKRLPIDAAGTGVLQAIQILSYVNVYHPHLLLLDEPDSHLHPNNQRLLAKMLINLAEKRDLQILMCTHSRHLLKAFSQDAKLHWIRNGELTNESNYDIINVLMDIGALDEGDKLNQGAIKAVILTEDEKPVALKTILESSGFLMDDIQVWPYNGCTKIETALVLSAFIRQQAPLTKILIHRDRDYLTDTEIDEFKARVEIGDNKCFISTGTDAESHFLNTEHINHIYPAVTIERARELIALATEEAKEKSIKKLIDARYESQLKKHYEGGERPSAGTISQKCNRDYADNQVRYRHGKTVLSLLKAKIQHEVGGNGDLLIVSPFIKNDELEAISKEIWD